MIFSEWKDFHKAWNDNHVKLIKDNQPYPYVNEGFADYCETWIVKAKEVYYNTDEVIMTDAMYDKLEDRLKILRPNSKILEKVG